jgi:hypothetical protein
LALFGRRPAERAECLVIAGVQKPAQTQTWRANWRHLRQWFGAHNANRPTGYRPALRRQIGRHSISTSNLAIGLVRGF